MVTVPNRLFRKDSLLFSTDTATMLRQSNAARTPASPRKILALIACTVSFFCIIFTSFRRLHPITAAGRVLVSHTLLSRNRIKEKKKPTKISGPFRSRRSPPRMARLYTKDYNTPSPGLSIFSQYGISKKSCRQSRAAPPALLFRRHEGGEKAELFPKVFFASFFYRKRKKKRRGSTGKKKKPPPPAYRRVKAGCN